MVATRLAHQTIDAAEPPRPAVATRAADLSPDWAFEHLRQTAAAARGRSAVPRSRRRTAAPVPPEAPYGSAPPAARYGSAPTVARYCRTCRGERRNAAVLSAELLGAGPAEVVAYGGFPVALCASCFARHRARSPAGARWMVVERYTQTPAAS
jgi:hypothetical protein